MTASSFSWYLAQIPTSLLMIQVNLLLGYLFLFAESPVGLRGPSVRFCALGSVRVV